jgi:hypothetical protein
MLKDAKLPASRRRRRRRRRRRKDCFRMGWDSARDLEGAVRVPAHRPEYGEPEIGRRPTRGPGIETLGWMQCLIMDPPE